MYGKPHPPIYAAARERLTKLMGAAPDNSRILAIGDGAKTDLAGAGRAGLDCLFIIEGVHAGDLLTPDGAIDAAGLAHLVKDAGARPVALARRLFW
jgi:ribonucleotide monophosphatase NagD (HAD superfamily)